MPALGAAMVQVTVLPAARLWQTVLFTTLSAVGLAVAIGVEVCVEVAVRVDVEVGV